MSSVFYLTYASQMTWRAGMNKHIFADIYRTANEFNASQDITGFLCFGDGYFFQYLEGDETKVRALFESICTDDRHTKITLLSTGYLPSKRFGAWDMAFINMHSPTIAPEIVAFFELLTPLLWQEDDIEHMITLFKNNYNTPEFIDKQVETDDLIYRYAGLYHLYRQHKNFLILQSISMMVVASIVMLIYFW